MGEYDSLCKAFPLTAKKDNKFQNNTIRLLIRVSYKGLLHISQKFIHY